MFKNLFSLIPIIFIIIIVREKKMIDRQTSILSTSQLDSKIN